MFGTKKTAPQVSSSQVANTSISGLQSIASPPPKPSVEDILIRESYVSEEDINKAREYAAKSNSTVIDYLLANNIISRSLLNQAVAESYGVSFVDLSIKSPTAESILKLPEDIAVRYKTLIVSATDTDVLAVTSDPSQPGLSEQLTAVFPGKNISIHYTPDDSMREHFMDYRKNLNTRFDEIFKNGNKIAPEILDEIFRDVTSMHASDIHFEPQSQNVVIRLRIDGALREVGRLPKDLYENVLNHIKVQAGLRIDEHFAAQDGALHFESKDFTVDMRISIVPTMAGEKIAIRVLSSYVKNFNLEDLGLSEHDQKILRDSSKKPFGMILVVGPTGSGKTTTLYAVLKLLNRPEVNITTIEDPVEYRLEGINQIQVNAAANLTFAKGLRSIVRQDPNIVLVGEIRDAETAEIAVNAALTGHLLLSTFHANDAATAIPRLLDIGIEPFLLSSTLEIIIAQRLVRRICESCRYGYQINSDEINKQYPGSGQYFSGPVHTLYKGKGCPACSMTGYKGRRALYEIIQITPEMEQLMLEHPSSLQISTLAHNQGSITMYEDGIEKVKNGVTTLEELSRVVAPPSLVNTYGKDTQSAK